MIFTNVNFIYIFGYFSMFLYICMTYV